MGELDARLRSGRAGTVLAVVVVLVVAVCVVTAARWMVGPDGPGHDAVGSLAESTPGTSSPEVTEAGLVPSLIALPTVGVETRVEPMRSATEFSPTLGRDFTTLGLPSHRSSAAWWSNGPKPGAAGVSVIVGESGDPGAPGVFDGIGGMDRGDKIVLRSDRKEIVTYLVSEVLTDIRSADPAALSEQFVSDPVAKAVALVTYRRNSGVQELGRMADVVVLGHLRTS